VTLPLVADYRRLVLEGTPLIDVRAPVEFVRGAFEGAVNLPLMNDEERHRVGIVYKRDGHDAAVALGYELVSGAVKEARIGAWTDFVLANPEAVVYCFRGGMRSRISQEWMSAALGRAVPRLEGGYKVFRGYLLGELTRERPGLRVFILGGRTGSGKTRLLPKIPWTIDLEGLAHHRGSSFGRFSDGQPTQIDFEHALAYALIRHEAEGHDRLLVEDEGNHIGRCYVLPEIRRQLYAGELVILETPMEERVQNIFEEYVTGDQALYTREAGEGGALAAWEQGILGSLDRIRKRLGGVRYTELSALIREATASQAATGELDGHRAWIRCLLEEYYDPMYDYQLETRAERIGFRGDAAQVLAYLGEA